MASLKSPSPVPPGISQPPPLIKVPKPGSEYLPLSESLRSKPVPAFGLMDAMDIYGSRFPKIDAESARSLSAPFVPRLELSNAEMIQLMVPGQDVMGYYGSKAMALIAKYADAGYTIDETDARRILNGPKPGFSYKSLAERVWDAAYISAVVAQIEKRFEESVCPKEIEPDIMPIPSPPIFSPLAFETLPENPDDCDWTYLDEQ